MLGTVWDEKMGKYFENPEAAVGNVLEACPGKNPGRRLISYPTPCSFVNILRIF
jgi:hypothetical protein